MSTGQHTIYGWLMAQQDGHGMESTNEAAIWPSDNVNREDKNNVPQLAVE